MSAATLEDFGDEAGDQESDHGACPHVGRVGQLECFDCAPTPVVIRVVDDE